MNPAQFPCEFANRARACQRSPALEFGAIQMRACRPRISTNTAERFLGGAKWPVS